MWIGLDGLLVARLDGATVRMAAMSDPLTGTLVLLDDELLDGASAWGTQVDAPVGRTESFVFAGMETLPGAPHKLAGHRLYDPDTGRFLSADPLGLDGGPHRFGYANGEPTRLVDPMGLSAVGVMSTGVWQPPGTPDCGPRCFYQDAGGTGAGGGGGKESGDQEGGTQEVGTTTTERITTDTSDHILTITIGERPASSGGTGRGWLSRLLGSFGGGGGGPIDGASAFNEPGGVQGLYHNAMERALARDWVNEAKRGTRAAEDAVNTADAYREGQWGTFILRRGEDLKGNTEGWYQYLSYVSPGNAAVNHLIDKSGIPDAFIDWGENKLHSAHQKNPTAAVIGSATGYFVEFLPVGPPAKTACFTEDAVLPTPSGPQPIADAQAGDRVLTGLSAPVRACSRLRQTCVAAVGALLAACSTSPVDPPGAGEEVLAYEPRSGAWVEVLAAEVPEGAELLHEGQLFEQTATGPEWLGAPDPASLHLADAAFSEVDCHAEPSPEDWVLVLDPPRHAPLAEVEEGETVAFAGRLFEVQGEEAVPTGDGVGRVVAPIVRQAPTVIEVRILGPSGEHLLFATPEHPFWVPARQGFRSIGSIPVGTTLHVQGGGEALLVGKTWRYGDVEVFNIEVEGLHSYYVHGQGGGDGVWVHNAGACAEAIKAALARAGLVAAQAGKRIGRGKNNLEPDSTAHGPHSTFKTDANGNVSNHAEWTPNPQNPTGFDVVKRVDVTGTPHYNKATGQTVEPPHTHEKGIPGGVRTATTDEIPK
jgi:RHS repeat-associated protein